MVFDRFLGWAVGALLVVAFSGACGNGSNPLGAAGPCAKGESFCATCAGSGFCSQACPTIACPSGDGGVVGDAAVGDASRADAHGCAEATPSSCLDCNGGAFCVAGACPLVACPARDAATTAFQSVCPGADPPPSGLTCRSAAECPRGLVCVPEPLGGCGAFLPPQHQCTTDANCGTLVCESYTETNPCQCAGSCTGTRCVQKCPGVACSSDSQCLASGHCQPTPCGQGYACAADLACKPSDATADAHGCALKLCSEGFPCASDQACNLTAAMADKRGCAPRPCSSGYACPTGWRCVAGPGGDPHGCTPIPCSNAAPCGVNETCDPTQPGRGCVPRRCTGDNDCDCGACVDGTCHTRLSVCSGSPP